MKTKARVILLGQGEGIMKTKARIILLGLVMVIALCYVNFANAESNSATGAAAVSGGAGAPVNLDFQIIIPEFIYFQVGSDLAVIDQIEFTPTADEVANATPGIAATAASGDLGSGSVTVSLVSNAGNITITERNDHPGLGLVSGSGNISYVQINTGDGAIPAPILSDAGGNTSPIVSAGGITDLSDVWTYTYTNPGTPPLPDTYTGRVTYTAAIP
jgi:hypothetical protein